MTLLYLSLKFKLALSHSNNALKLEEFALFRSLILSRIPSESYPAWSAYARYALNVLFIDLIFSALCVIKYHALDFAFFFLIW